MGNFHCRRCSLNKLLREIIIFDNAIAKKGRIHHMVVGSLRAQILGGEFRVRGRYRERIGIPMVSINTTEVCNHSRSLKSTLLKVNSKKKKISESSEST